MKVEEIIQNMLESAKEATKLTDFDFSGSSEKNILVTYANYLADTTMKNDVCPKCDRCKDTDNVTACAYYESCRKYLVHVIRSKMVCESGVIRTNIDVDCMRVPHFIPNTIVSIDIFLKK